MEKKQEYIAPAVLDELLLEMEGTLLVASAVDEPIDEDVVVDTMGQELGDDLTWDHKWK